MYKCITPLSSNTGREFKKDEIISEKEFFNLPYHELGCFTKYQETWRFCT